MLSFGFPPVSSPAGRVLLLGSLPGRLSLLRGEYYANPQNAFWKIVAARIPDLPADYAGRVAALVRELFGSAGAGEDCAPASPGRRGRAAPQLHR